MFCSSYHRATQSFFYGYKKAEDVIGMGSSCLPGGSCHPEDARSAPCHHLAFSEIKKPWGAESAAAAPGPRGCSVPRCCLNSSIHATLFVVIPSLPPSCGTQSRDQETIKSRLPHRTPPFPQLLSKPDIFAFIRHFPSAGACAAAPSSGASRGAPVPAQRVPRRSLPHPARPSCSQHSRGFDSHPILPPPCITKAKSECYLSKLPEFCFQASQLAFLSR